MLLSEFIDRTGYQPTAEEYAEIEQAYYVFDGDKDKFCKAWSKANPHKAGMKEYQLHCAGGSHCKPWCIGVKTSFGWQQVSPWYFYKGHALNWCKRNNIVLS